ncbi:MAG: FAD-dependent oxidoreductase [Planctomycetia bacterium]|nr:FAD-dependent oxidoreductase [Planctomycetia bacterium]
MICGAVANNMDRLWDVLIVGSGVAGAMAAYGAARQGKSVLLIDKARFPRGKACGCCLNKAAVDLLDQTGLNVRLLGAVPVDRFQLACAGTRAMLHTPPGLAISREILDVALIGHAQRAGACFMPQTAAQQTQAFPLHRTVDVLTSGIPAVLRAKVVLAADGLGGRLMRETSRLEIASNSRIGVAATLEHAGDAFAPGIIYMACGKHGYVGLVIVEAGQLHIAAALGVNAVRDASGPGHAVEEIMCEAGMPVPLGLDKCRWYGAPALTCRRKIIAAPRLFVIGDAAGYVEPFSGEGMAWALASGLGILSLVDQVPDVWRPDLEEQWQRRHHDLVVARQRTCRAVTMLLRHQGLLRMAIRALRLSPALAVPFLWKINKPFINI